MKQTSLSYKSVQYIPEKLAEGVLYISSQYSTAAHRCCCGCGEEVITPLNPTDWSVKISQSKVSLYPSIGNWSYPCRSHYWIKNGRIIWAEEMSQQQINKIRTLDHANKQAYFNTVNARKSQSEKHNFSETSQPPKQPGFLSSIWAAIKSWLKKH